MKVRRPWTPEEDQFIKDNINVMTYQALADNLKRPRTAISNRIISLGVRRKRKWYWTKDEDKFLKESLKTKTDAEIAKHLGRTASSVTSRINVLKLETGRTRSNRPRDWTPDEEDFIKENVDQMRMQEIADRLGCSRGQAERRAIKLGVYERKPQNPEKSQNARDILEFETGVRRRVEYRGGDAVGKKVADNPFHMIF